MGQVLHGSPATTEAVRQALQLCQESVRALAKRFGVSPTTVQKASAPHPGTLHLDRSNLAASCRTVDFPYPHLPARRPRSAFDLAHLLYA